MAHPATKRRGGDPDVAPRPPQNRSADDLDRRLDEGLEETMAGSDPVNIIQPLRSKVEKQHEDKHNGD